MMTSAKFAAAAQQQKRERGIVINSSRGIDDLAFFNGRLTVLVRFVGPLARLPQLARCAVLSLRIACAVPGAGTPSLRRRGHPHARRRSASVRETAVGALPAAHRLSDHSRKHTGVWRGGRRAAPCDFGCAAGGTTAVVGRRAWWWKCVCVHVWRLTDQCGLDAPHTREQTLEGGRKRCPRKRSRRRRRR